MRKALLLIASLSLAAGVADPLPFWRTLLPDAFPAASGISGESGAGKILSLDPRFEQLVPPNAAIEKVANGFTWLEGPVWHKQKRALLFSDIPANSVHEWTAQAGAKLFLQPSGYSDTSPFSGREPGSNGLALDPQGRLVICQHGNRRIVRVEENGRQTILADRFRGQRLNSPNDAVFDSKGNLYFTDPPFGLPKAFDDPAKELPFSGVYRLSKKGELELLTRDLPAPNGIAFSPDEKTLYLTNADPVHPVWWAFELRPDGRTGKGRVFFDGAALTRYGRGSADGMKVDSAGNIYAAGPGGIHVFAPDGTHLGSLLLGVATSNCAWGEDGSVLYITASTAIYRIRLRVKGAGF